MRLPCIALVLVCLFTGAHASTVELYQKAVSLCSAKNDEAALPVFLEAAEAARNEGKASYLFSAYYQASFTAHRLSKNMESMRYAGEALLVAEQNRSGDWTRRRTNLINEIELIGLLERGHGRLAQIGAAWNQHRRAVSRYREVFGLPADDRRLEPGDVARMTVDARPLGWRLIEREAHYLHETGQTTQAKSLLRSAIAAAESDLDARVHRQSFYPVKMVGSLASMEGFTGYDQLSLDLLQKEKELCKSWADRSHLQRIEMNWLINFADLQGANDEIVKRADAVLAEATAAGSINVAAFKRMHTHIAARHLSHEQRVARLLAAADESRRMENEEEHFFSSRDVLFEQAARNRPGLDGEFHAFLNQTRLQGNLRAEPRIYRRYGDWLRLQGRYADAIRTYRQALQLTLRFEWHPLVPQLYAKLGATYLADGQDEQARAMWAEVARYAVLHPDIPAVTILSARHIQLHALLRAGLLAEAALFAQEWYRYGVAQQVPSRSLAPFEPAVVKAYKPGTNPAAGAASKHVLLHPTIITTVALPEQDAVTAVYLLNPDSKPASGTLAMRGPGPRVLDGGKDQLGISFSVAGPEKSLALPLSLGGGDFVKIQLVMPPGRLPAPEAPATIHLVWTDDATGQTRTMLWHYSQGGTAVNASVLEAAQVGFNPFIGLPVQHSVHIPEAGETPVAFRVRASSPLRIEYLDSTTGRLLAVDNNGNGDFTESGDFWTPVRGEKPGISSPALTAGKETSTATIEVWYFPNETTGGDREIELSVELHQPAGWQQQAIDRLTFAK
jgi:tetratricopeptide (TPR) repeat protein